MIAGCERQATARLIAELAELDARRLYLGQGCSSMFTYYTQVLHLAEHAAYKRIEAARAARRFPVILTRLADGSVHLSAVRLLAPHLTRENHIGVLREASHKSKREVEQIVARLQPQPDVVASVRKLPATRTIAAPVQPRAPQAQPNAIAAAVDVPSPPRSEVAPLAPALPCQIGPGPSRAGRGGSAAGAMRSAPPQGEAGKRAQRFLAATSHPVIRINLYTTGASVRLAHVVHTHP
jgi:hypothetical protein